VPYVDPPRPPEYSAARKRRARFRPGHALWNALLATIAVGGALVVSLENLLHLPTAVRVGIVAVVVGGTFIISLLGLDDD
jgi:ABC-type enterobactin transport system permease subunit